MPWEDVFLDLADIALVSWIFYRLLLVFRQTRAIRVVMGLIVLALVYWGARLMNLEGLLGLVDTLRGNRLEVGSVILAIIFADEIRDAFGGVFWRFARNGPRGRAEVMIDEVALACGNMANRGIGALIAITRENPLDRWELADSVPIDARVSAQLLETIFSGKSPLHDGAVIIRDDRVVAAKCQFPPSSNPSITQHSVGMRHRAAFGLSEHSDAVVLVVSEERREIALVTGANYQAPIEKDQLPRLLRDLLRVKVVRRPWYHPRRVLANGWLKLLASFLALAVWGEQVTTFPVNGPVQIHAQGESSPRQIPLTHGQIVVVRPGTRIRRVASEGEPRYTQSIPDVEYLLLGQNRQRLMLGVRQFGAWLTGAGASLSELAGPVWIEIPAGSSPSPEPQSLDLRYRGPFQLQATPIIASLDELAPLPADAIELELEGQTMVGYSLISRTPIEVRLSDADLVVPKRALDSVSVALKPCSTRPMISIQGATASFDRSVQLLVPEDLRRWNPETSFQTRVSLDIVSDELRSYLNQQLSEGQRKELETARNEAIRRREEARVLWVELDRRLKDNSWETDYRLERYQNLTQRTLPDLIQRIQKDEIEVNTVDEKIQRLRAEWAEAELRSDTVASSLRLFNRERELRSEIVQALKDVRDFREREALAVGERIKPLLEAIDKAQKLREEWARTEFALPAVDKESNLRSLIELRGPAGRMATEGTRALSTDASSRSTLLLFGRGVNAFERWNDGLRDSRAAIRDIDSIRKQLAGSQPATAAAIRLELALREKEELLKAHGTKVLRQAELWKDLRERLIQDNQSFIAKSEVLEYLTVSWPAETVRGMEPAPIVDLFREIQIEWPSLIAAQGFFEELASRAEAPATTEFAMAANEWSDYVKNLAIMAADARIAAERWQIYREIMRRRLSILAAIAARMAIPELPTEDFRAELAQLERDVKTLEIGDADVLAETARIRDSMATLVRIDHLDSLQVEISQLTAEIAKQTLQRDERLTAVAEIERRMAVTPPPPDAKILAARWSAERIRAIYLDAWLRSLGIKRGRLEQRIALIRPYLEPYLTTLRSRLSEIELAMSRPIDELDRASRYLEDRLKKEPAYEDLLTELDKLQDAPAGAALVARIKELFEPLSADDQGLEFWVALQTRLESSLAKAEELKSPGPEESVDPTAGRPRAAAQLRQRLRERELGLRLERIGRMHEAIDSLSRHLVESQRLSAFVKSFNEKLTPRSAKLMPIASLEDARAALIQAIARRKTQIEEARAEAEKRPLGEERTQFERRAEALNKRLGRLDRSEKDLDSMISAIKDLAGASFP